MSSKADKVQVRKIATSAILSADEKHRYRLDRIWNPEAPVLVFIMLNPSTADAKTDDPTIRRCMSFADDMGCGGVVVFNLFSLRTPYPEELWRSDQPVRKKNIAEVAHGLATLNVKHVVAAWGAAKGPKVSPLIESRVIRTRAVVDGAGFALKCLGQTKMGKPRHPLYLHSDTQLQGWPLGG